MDTYVVLLRGINVGGKNLLPMEKLKHLLNMAGFDNVKTYIQSGNVVLTSVDNPASHIERLIEAECGFRTEVLAFLKENFNRAAVNNPYQSHNGSLVHFFFCKETPKPNPAAMTQYAADSESYQLIDQVFYLHAPDGIGRSKLVKHVEACVGVRATGRNLNTIRKIQALMGGD